MYDWARNRRKRKRKRMQRRRHRRTRKLICVGVDAGWTSSDVVLAGALDVRLGIVLVVACLT